jgi:hypothetical protein
MRFCRAINDLSIKADLYRTVSLCLTLGGLSGRYACSPIARSPRGRHTLGHFPMKRCLWVWSNGSQKRLTLALPVALDWRRGWSWVLGISCFVGYVLRYAASSNYRLSAYLSCAQNIAQTKALISKGKG